MKSEDIIKMAELAADEYMDKISIPLSRTLTKKESDILRTTFKSGYKTAWIELLDKFVVLEK